MPAPSNPTARTDDGYRYAKFTTRLMLQDLRFSHDALAPGDRLPVEWAEDADGARVRLVDRHRPLLLITGSITCPMTASAMPALLTLHESFADRIDIALLSAREAHPGERIPQPLTDGEIRAQAVALRDHYTVPFPVLVDHVDGRLHRLLDGKPNTAFLFDTDGTLVFRSLWASDATGLRRALDAVARGGTPEKGERRAMLGPIGRALGYIDAVVGRAGRRARRDLWRSAPPMAAMGRLASALRFVPTHRRGAGVMAAAAPVFLLGVAVAIRLVS